MALPYEDQLALAAERRSAPLGTAGSGIQKAVGTKTPAPYVPPRITSTASGQYTRPMGVPSAAAGAVPDITAFLNQDTSYNDQVRQFAQALADMQADVTRRRGTLTTDFESSKKALGDQRLKDLENIEADYGSRGLLRSGLYAKAQGDYETEYNTRVSDLGRHQTDALSMLDQELNQYMSQQNLQQQAAREAAIRRRAEQYGV